MELRQRGARIFSSFLIPLAAVAAAYYAITGGIAVDLAHPPAFEWAAYLGASLILAALAAHMQTLHHRAARDARDNHVSIGDRRIAFRAAERNWIDEQRRRTTTAFWTDEIKKNAIDAGAGEDELFSQEVSKLFVAWGWDVKLNQRTHDYGVDIFASGKDGSAVVFCQHGVGGPATNEVRDLAGSRHAFNADYGLLISIHPPSASRQNEFFSDKAQLEFWHLGHILEQCMVLYKKRTGEEAPADSDRASFLNPDGTPIVWEAATKEAAE